MKNNPIVIIAKKNHTHNQHNWQYRLESNPNIYEIQTQGNFLDQLTTLINHILTTHYTPTQKITIIPLYLPTTYHKQITDKNPNLTIIPPPNISTRERLRYLLNHKQKRPTGTQTTPNNKNTIYIATDAGGGATLNEKNIWAWVKESATKPTYQYNTATLKHTHLAELEGILNAIIQNHQHNPTQNLHLYCDSTVAIELYETLTTNPNNPNLTQLQPLITKIQKIQKTTNIKLEWVPSHSNHYLNEIADTIVALKNPKNNTQYPTQNLNALVALFSLKFPEPKK